MKQRFHPIRLGLLGLFAASLVLLAGAGVAAQAQGSNTNYRATSRDPFTRYRPPVRRPASAATQVTPPPIQERIEQYRAQKQAAMNAQLPAPKPTTALLLSEVQVTGIFRTPRGYAAMIEATPIRLSYVIYPGEIFYDGQLVAIEETRLVFRREMRWSNGRRELTVEFKPLRQSNPGPDPMSPTGAAATAASASSPGASANGEAAPAGPASSAGASASNRREGARPTDNQ